MTYLTLYHFYPRWTIFSDFCCHDMNHFLPRGPCFSFDLFLACVKICSNLNAMTMTIICIFQRLLLEFRVHCHAFMTELLPFLPVSFLLSDAAQGQGPLVGVCCQDRVIFFFSAHGRLHALIIPWAVYSCVVYIVGFGWCCYSCRGYIWLSLLNVLIIWQQFSLIRRSWWVQISKITWFFCVYRIQVSDSVSFTPVVC